MTKRYVVNYHGKRHVFRFLGKARKCSDKGFKTGQHRSLNIYIEHVKRKR